MFGRPGLITYRRLLGDAKRYWLLFVIGALGTVVLSGVDASLTWFLKPVLDKGFIHRDVLFIRWLPIIVFIIFVARGCGSFLSDYCISRVALTVVTDFRRRLFDHYMQLPARFYDQARTGDLLGLIVYNVEQVAEACSTSLITVLRESTLLIGLVVVMLSISWEMSLFFMVMTPLIAFVIAWCAKRLRRLSASVQCSVGDVTTVAEEAIDNYKVVRIFGGQPKEKKKFFTVTKHNLSRSLKVVITNSLGSAGVQLIVSVPIAATLYFATQPSFHVSAGSFAAMIASMISLLRPFRRLTTVNATFQKGIAGADSIYQIIDEPGEVDRGDVSVSQQQGLIEIDRVFFRYVDDGNWILRDVSLTVKPGQTLALVGRSGGGKTTLANLLPRFYDIQSGEINVDGVNIQDYSLAALRHQFSMVSQNTTLFNDTIANNVTYGLKDVSDVDLRQAIEAACAAEFIDRFPNGVNEIIGEDGVLLSGGQRQRIAIARALLKQAPILILDEATSALDSHSERHIQQALSQLMKGSTAIVIAHRLSTIENADWIAVIDEGCVVEQGTHADLIALNGAYVQLRAIQYRHHQQDVDMVDA